MRRKVADGGEGKRVSGNREAKPQGLREEALMIRRGLWRAFHAAGSGHIGGSASAELLAEALPTPMRFVGMSDEFAIVGPTDKVGEHYGMSAEAIEAACLDLLK